MRVSRRGIFSLDFSVFAVKISIETQHSSENKAYFGLMLAVAVLAIAVTVFHPWSQPNRDSEPIAQPRSTGSAGYRDNARAGASSGSTIASEAAC